MPKTPTKSTAHKKRQITKPRYKSFRLSKRIKHDRPVILGSFRLMKQSIQTILKRKKLFLGITFVYLLLTILLVKGFGANTNISELKDNLTELFNGTLSGIVTSFTLFTALLGNLGSTSGGNQANAYQPVLLVTTSLAVIWALRQTLSKETKNKKIAIRDAYYKGLYPLVPFLLVVLVIGLELLPIVFANFVYTAVFGGGLAVNVIERFLWVLLLLLLVLLSLYLVTSSIFALYIVTLPDMRPMQALRSARELVRYRRWTIMRKLLFLPASLLIVAGLLIIPVIMIEPTVAEWMFFVLSMLSLVVLHSYLYTLYRELL